MTFGVFNAAGECVQEVNDLVLQRQFTVQEMKLLGAAAGLQLVGLYGDFDLAAPIATVTEEDFRMIAVYKPLPA